MSKQEELAPRAAIYSRLSRNRSGLESESTARQTAACEKLAKQQGFTVVLVETDEDKSAYSGKPRPGYTKVMQAVVAGQVDVIVAWSPDRLHRRPAELETFVDDVIAAQCTVMTVQTGHVDLQSAQGLFSARLFGSLARYESDLKSDRFSSMHNTRASKGQWKGGHRPYGYEYADEGRGDLVIVAAEAAIIREAVQRVLIGETIGAIFSDLNKRNVATSQGSKWSSTTLRTILVSPTIAGRRIHKGEDVAIAQWDPIIDLETHRAVVSVLLSRSPKRGRAPRVALFTGHRIACGRCSNALTTARKEQGVRLYRCTECYLSVRAEPVEDLVVAAMLQRLDASELSGATKQKSKKVFDDVNALEAQLTELAAELGSGAISRAEWLAIRDGLLTRIAAASDKADKSLQANIVAGLSQPGAVRTMWPDMTLQRRQDVVDVLVDVVVVAPATKLGRQFDDERVDVRWKI